MDAAAAGGSAAMPPTDDATPAADAVPAAAKGFQAVGSMTSSLAARMELSKKRRYLLKKEVALALGHLVGGCFDPPSNTAHVWVDCPAVPAPWGIVSDARADPLDRPPAMQPSPTSQNQDLLPPPHGSPQSLTRPPSPPTTLTSTSDRTPRF